MNFKKTYIHPNIHVLIFDEEHDILAGSPKMKLIDNVDYETDSRQSKSGGFLWEDTDDEEGQNNYDY